MFRRDVLSKKGTREIDDKASATFEAWDKSISKPTMRKSEIHIAPPNLKSPFIGSEKSVISVGEVMDFEDYVPFKPKSELEQIDEEKVVNLFDNTNTQNNRNKITINSSLREANMSEEESFNSRKESSDSTDENKDEFNDDLSDNDAMMPK